MASFTTLWIYTILKPICGKEHYQEVSLPYGFTLFSNQMTADLAVGNVSLPYGFTLFSNCGVWIRFAVKVSLPYGFTLFSNNSSTSERFIEFHYLMDLHYSQTLKNWTHEPCKFHYLMDLHYSQTVRCIGVKCFGFHYLMDLHYSQTIIVRTELTSGFTTLWIYTILKRQRQWFQWLLCFTTLWIYTILKPSILHFLPRACFTTLWIYTILKLSTPLTDCARVSLPYGFTLFSNLYHSPATNGTFHYLMDLHYSQTSNKLRPLYSAGQIHKI